MARYQPSPEIPTALDVIEELGAFMGGRYTAAENRLLAEIARRVKLDMNTDNPTRRLTAIRELRAEAERVMAELATEDAARRVVTIAAEQGEATALHQLGIGNAAAAGAFPDALGPTGNVLPFATGLTPQGALAAAQIAFDLTSSLADARQRILRATPDLYQRTVAQFAAQRTLGVGTGREVRTRTVADFLDQGIGGFTDAAGRRWSMGAYAEMATRTATNRAWQGASIARWQASGIRLASPVRGSDACPKCAAWSGKVLSTDGTPAGQVELEHATERRRVMVTIDATIEQARSAGWNHPNCRCTLAPVFPGLSRPTGDTTYDPQAEADRERLRYLERRVRSFKRREEIAAGLGDDVAARQYRRRARAEQRRIREHVAATGQVRKNYREQLSFGGYSTAPTR